MNRRRVCAELWKCSSSTEIYGDVFVCGLDNEWLASLRFLAHASGWISDRRLWPLSSSFSSAALDVLSVCSARRWAPRWTCSSPPSHSPAPPSPPADRSAPQRNHGSVAPPPPDAPAAQTRTDHATLRQRGVKKHKLIFISTAPLFHNTLIWTLIFERDIKDPCQLPT